VSTFAEIATILAEIGRHCYARGWALGTSGNFSAVSNRDPLRLAITVSGVDKGHLSTEQIVEIDERGNVIRGLGQPSAETNLHLTIVRARNAGAVLHTHSIWSTILSDAATDGGLAIEGYEMLKGLQGVTTHEHREWVPIVENSQDCRALAESFAEILRQRPATHAILLRRHGLYTWGADLD
jgi:methylthioribulose-1-phosphate dehydratase